MSVIKIIATITVFVICRFNAYAQLKFPDILSESENFIVKENGFVDSLSTDFDLTKVQSGNFAIGYNGSTYIFNSVVSGKTKFFFMKEQIGSSNEVYDNRGVFIENDSIVLYVGFKLKGSRSDFLPYAEIDLIRNGDFNEIHSVMVLDRNLKTKCIVYYEAGKALFVDKLFYNEEGRVDAIFAGTSADIRKLDLEFNILDGFTDLTRGKVPLRAISPRIPHINRDYFAYLWLFQGIYENELSNSRIHPDLFNIYKN